MSLSAAGAGRANAKSRKETILLKVTLNTANRSYNIAGGKKVGIKKRT